MKKAVLGLILISTIAFCSDSDWAKSTYFGIQYHAGNYEESDLDLSATGIGFKLGTEYNDNLDIEFRYINGLSGDSTYFISSSTLYELDYDLNYIFSILIKPKYTIKQKPFDKSPLTIYGLVGFAKAEMKASVKAIKFSDIQDDSGLTYGFGIEGAFGRIPSLSIFSEYVSYINDSDYDYTGINFGLTYNLN